MANPIIDLFSAVRGVWIAGTDASGNPAPNSSTAPFTVKAAPQTYVSKKQITGTATVSTAITTGTPSGVPAAANTAIVQNAGTVAVSWAVGAAATTDQSIAAGGYLTLDIGNANLSLVQFIAASGTFDLRITFYA